MGQILGRNCQILAKSEKIAENGLKTNIFHFKISIIVIKWSIYDFKLKMYESGGVPYSDHPNLPFSALCHF